MVINKAHPRHIVLHGIGDLCGEIRKGCHLHPVYQDQGIIAPLLLLAEGMIGEDEEETFGNAGMSVSTEVGDEGAEDPGEDDGEEHDANDSTEEGVDDTEEDDGEEPIEAGAADNEEQSEDNGEELGEESESDGLDQPIISFPISAHRPDSILNLVSTIYSRGKLLSKSTGGMFSASRELVEALNRQGTVDGMVKAIQSLGGLQGLSFEEGRVIFDGFPVTEDEEAIQAWTALATAINKNAIRQKHVRAKEVDDSNEKFAFRTWLIRLGMNGPEFKKERKVLYRNLGGHTAFRTPADEEKWKEKHARRREDSPEE